MKPTNHSYKYFITLLLAIFFSVNHPTFLFSQIKGANVVGNTKQVTEGKTYALIIGISKYETVQSLNYADQDARVLAGYLKFHPAWKLPEEQMMVLLNERAKNGDILEGLTWLKDEISENDRVIIYFSGHGDVETLTDVNEGYLLAHNTPKNNYIFGGVPVGLVKNFINTYINKGARVLLITDACRSGQLAGGTKGPELTSSALKQKWFNEVKILSSQPNQSSLESDQWGGGRGVFSYYLMKGLLGEADQNKNDTVTLSELEFYLGSHVTSATNGNQEPVFEASNKFTTIMARVDQKVKGEWVNDQIPVYGKRSDLISFYQYPEWTYDGSDSRYLFNDSLYARFQMALNKGDLLGEITSAKAYYEQYRLMHGEDKVCREMKRQLKASLINQSQEIINVHLSGRHFVKQDDFKKGLDYTVFALELMADDDPLRSYYQAKTYFFEAGKLYGLYSNESIESRINIDKSLKKIDQAIAMEPQAAYLYEMKGVIYISSQNYRKAEECLLRSIELSPTWLLPRYELGMLYYNMGKRQKSLQYLKESISMDPQAAFAPCGYCLKKFIAEIYTDLKQYAEAELVYTEVIKSGYYGQQYSAYYDLIDFYIERNAFEKARTRLNEVAAMDSSHFVKLNRLYLEYREGKADLDSLMNEVVVFRKSMLVKDADSSLISSLYFMEAGMYEDKYPDDKSAYSNLLQQALKYDPADNQVVLLLAQTYYNENEFTRLNELLDQSLNYITNPDVLSWLFSYVIYGAMYENKDDLMEQSLNRFYDTGILTCEMWKEWKFDKNLKKYPFAKSIQQKICSKK